MHKRDPKIGDKITITKPYSWYANSMHQNIEAGEIYEITSVNRAQGNVNAIKTSDHGIRITKLLFDKFKLTYTTKKEINEGIKELELEIKNMRDKIEYMEKENLEQFDSEEYEIYKLVQSLDPKIDKKIQARNIYQIIHPDV